MTSGLTQKPLRLADYYVWNSLGDLAIAPDGSRVAYVQRGARKSKNDHFTNLWLAETDGKAAPHRLTRTLSRDSAPAFSPDGRYLAFLSTREDELEVAEAAQGNDKEKGKNGKPKTQVWLFDLARGGEPRQVTTLSEGAASFDWAPDSARLVVAARTPTPAQQKYLEAIRGDEKGPVQLRRMQHKADGRGFLDEVRTHLHVVDLATRTVTQLTDGPCDELDPQWSPDGQWIAFGSNRTGKADTNGRRDLWLIRPDGSECRRLTRGDLNAGRPRWSPDSRHVAFSGNLVPENAYKLRHVLTVSVADSQPVEDLAACVGQGWSELGGTVPDLAPGADLADPAENARRYPVPLDRTPCRVLTAGVDRTMMGVPSWVDAETLLVPAGDRGQTRLLRVSLTGEAAFVFPTERDQDAWNFATAAGKLVVTLDSPQTGPDLISLSAFDPAGSDPVRLTLLNAAMVAERDLARYERVEFTGSNGDTVEALVAVPPGWSPEAGRAPVVVSIHGGPMAYDGPMFQFARQYWAGMGYLVLMVNYHGSISYGEAFCESIRGKWGPMEHADLEAGVDHLIKLGWADPDRLFVTGFSQGGIMTNWAVGHTDRFRAAVSEHGMWNYIMSYGTDDCHNWWQDDMGAPWQNPAPYQNSSPYSALANIKTPTLIMAGEVDWRCPLTESEQMYIGLQKRGIPTQLIVYQGENHAISKPRRMIDRVRRICSWFAQYGGIPLNDDTAEGYPDQE